MSRIPVTLPPSGSRSRKTLDLPQTDAKSDQILANSATTCTRSVATASRQPGATWFVVILLMMASTGCPATSNNPRRLAGGATTTGSNTGDDLFESAVATLMRIELLCDVTKYEDDEIQRRLNTWIEFRDPPIAWEPVPNEAAQRQIVDRLNGWSPSRLEDVDWEADPLIGSLPPQLGDTPQLKSLGDATFTIEDARFLEMARWLGGVSERAAGSMSSDLDRAVALFDWTVRNIQLEADEPAPPMRLPHQTLLLGRGTKEERAWVFMLLARQQGMQVVMLAYPDAEESETLRDWLPALHSDGHLYLFDPWLGLPVPGPGGKGIATLAEVANDDSLLRRLDLSQTRPYPVSADQLAAVTALVAALPESLSRRMKLLESRLVGQQRLVLSASPREWVEPLKACDHVTDVKLWPYPYLVIRHAMSIQRDQRQQAVDELKPLMIPFQRTDQRDSQQQEAKGWNPRMTLYRKIKVFDHLFIFIPREITSSGDPIPANYPVGPEGNVHLGPKYGPVQVAGLTLEGARSAIDEHLSKVISDPNVSVRFAGGLQTPDAAKLERVCLWRGRIRHLSGRLTGEQNAVKDYFNTRLPEDQLADERIPDGLRQILTLSKQHATHWLGLISYDLGKHQAAQSYFSMTLEKWPDGPWTGGARFNLARVHEATGEPEKAIELYLTDISAQLHGNRLRGRWLKEKQSAKSTTH